MFQILQSLKDGNMTLEDVPAPSIRAKGVLVRTQCSLISAGTERMVVELASKSLLQKAKERPDLVRKVLEKFKKEGFASTYRSVNSKLNELIQLGYSAAGIVEEAGSDCPQFKPGDRVAIAGAGYANHAEYCYVPRNLVAPIPDSLSFEEGAYSTVASIAMQGIRLAEPTIGEYAVVIGLGLIGLIAIQILRVGGCRVIGLDIDEQKVARAKEMGADLALCLRGSDIDEHIQAYTQGHGADLVLIAAATKSDGPIELAGKITRRRARVVVVGAVGMGVPRDPYFKKELSLRISMSYGPGRYDKQYEEEGNDYPYEFVRWTENRNMQSVLGLMERGDLDVKTLTTHRYDFKQALEAYQLLQSKTQYLGIVLNYPAPESQNRPVQKIVLKAAEASPKENLGIGFVGAGGYASVHLLPNVQAYKGARLRGIVCATGPSARQKGQRFGFDYCSTDFEELVSDNSVNGIFIATRHDTHARFTIKALEAGKCVFVEKPLATTPEELQRILEAYQKANASKPTCLMVGTNRRFAKMVTAIKEHLGSHIVQMHYRICPGPLPKDAWFQDSQQGGGMLISEMCHFVDVLRYLAGSSIISVYARANRCANRQINDNDNLSIIFQFANGSLGTIAYTTLGASEVPKERLEVFGGGRAAMLDDFRTLELFGDGKPRKQNSVNQDKGQPAQIQATLDAFKAGQAEVIPIVEMTEVMEAIFLTQQSLREGKELMMPSYFKETIT